MGNHKVLKTAGTAARYSMYEFIDAIRSQQIIWDRRHPNFHNRALRDKSWQLIGRELCNNFDLASAIERQEIVKTLLKRWKNTRDSYLRINRLRQSGQDVGRASYIYEKELRFLLDVKAETEEDEKTSPKKTTALAKRKRAKSMILKAPSKRKSKIQNTEFQSISDLQKEIIESDSQHSVIDDLSTSLTQDTEAVGDVIVGPCSSSIIEFSLESDTDVNTSPSKPTFAASKDPDSYIYDKELRFLLDVKAETVEDGKTSPKKTTALAKRKRAKSIVLKAPSKRKSQTQNTEFPSISDHQKEIIESDSQHSVIDECSTSLIQDTEAVADVIVDPCSSSIIEFALESETDANSSSSEPTFDVSNNPDPDQAFFDSIKPHMQLMSNARKLDFQIEVLQLLRNFNPN